MNISTMDLVAEMMGVEIINLRKMVDALGSENNVLMYDKDNLRSELDYAKYQMELTQGVLNRYSADACDNGHVLDQLRKDIVDAKDNVHSLNVVVDNQTKMIQTLKRDSKIEFSHEISSLRESLDASGIVITEYRTENDALNKTNEELHFALRIQQTAFVNKSAERDTLAAAVNELHKEIDADQLSADEDNIDQQTEIENMRSFLIAKGLDVEYTGWNESPVEVVVSLSDIIKDIEDANIVRNLLQQNTDAE